MSKAVLISIKPRWCELIASGKKTIEVRKTKPKLETPFKCYIYETLGEKIKLSNCVKGTINRGIGKVIGEFVCDKIFEIEYQCGSYRCKGLTVLENDRVASASKLSLRDMRSYLSCNNGYAWNISDLVIYDEPRKLREFIVERYPCLARLTRPPQSWLYVESEVEGK